jgi:hypothetical protein
MAHTTTLQVHRDHVHDLLLRLRDEENTAREHGLPGDEYRRYREIAQETLVNRRMRGNLLAFLDYWDGKDGHSFLVGMVRDLSTRQVVEYFSA